MGHNVRVGVFFCNCNGKIAEKVDCGFIASEVKKNPVVEFVRESQNLCAHLEGELMVKEIDKHQLNRVAVVGCSMAGREKFFTSVLKKAGLDPHYLSMANISEACSNVHGNSPAATAKALELTMMAIARAVQLEEVGFGEFSVERTVLVIGGGLAGLETALECADRGFKVIIIEKEDKLGGRLSRVNSISGAAIKPAGLLQEKIKNVESNGNIEVRTGTRLADMDGAIGNFTTYFVKNGTESTAKVGAIVVATGVQTIFCPVKYGLGIADNVIGQMKLERLLADGKDFTRKKISFVVGKTTEDYTLSFLVAMKNALLLREQYKASVNFFYTNIKVGGDDWEALYTEARAAGVNFFKFVDKLEIIAQNNEITISYEDPFIQGKLPGTCKITSDYIVLPEEIVPAEGTEELAKILKLELGPGSFFGADNVHLLPAYTSRDGIYLAGGCQSPCMVPDIKISARTIAGEILKTLYADKVLVELTSPTVDPPKCVVCLTCYRCCPHQAITIEHREEFKNLYKSAAQMNPLACRRCGICAAECPGKAVQMPDYTDAQILAQLEVVEG
ncbi:MAG: CoB--CoM heterodisulfide reductase iron-sulfur subunit A family protein [Bacillota bacterium]